MPQNHSPAVIPDSSEIPNGDPQLRAVVTRLIRYTRSQATRIDAQQKSLDQLEETERLVRAAQGKLIQEIRGQLEVLQLSEKDDLAQLTATIQQLGLSVENLSESQIQTNIRLQRIDEHIGEIDQRLEFFAQDLDQIAPIRALAWAILPIAEENAARHHEEWQKFAAIAEKIKSLDKREKNLPNSKKRRASDKPS